MSTTYRTPGVYIEEQTGPGVITGVGTSTAAFIGAAERGPLDRAERITTFDDFRRIYGSYMSPSPKTGGRWRYLAFAVEGFFGNGGSEAYVLRVGTGIASELALMDSGTPARAFAVVRARREGVAGQNIGVELSWSGDHPLANPSANVDSVGGGDVEITLDDASGFALGDTVTLEGNAPNPRGRITAIQGTTLTVDAPFANAQNRTLKLADPRAGDTSIRLAHADGLSAGSWANLRSAAGEERIEITSVDGQTGRIDLAAPLVTGVAPGANTSVRRIFPLVIPKADKVKKATAAQDADATRVELDGGKAAVERFRPGDVVDVGSDRVTVLELQDTELVVNRTITPSANAAVAIADIERSQRTFRVIGAGGLTAGGLVVSDAGGGVATSPAVEIASVDAAGFVTMRDDPKRTADLPMNVAQGASPWLEARDLRLVVKGPASPGGTTLTQVFDGLSVGPRHPRFVAAPGVVDAALVEVIAPDDPSSATGDAALPVIPQRAPLAGGRDDEPGQLRPGDYGAALDMLRDYDAVNLVCVPDAAADPAPDAVKAIQRAQLEHCINAGDRFAVIDAKPGAEPSPTGIEAQRGDVEDDRGFAALYYPWLVILDPTTPRNAPSRRIAIPPCGHIAGVMAREDGRRGVHKAPANVSVLGVLGLERVISDRQQAPLNDAGINALRIFPGSGDVIVWGARTTVRKDVTDWRYVPVRRLLLFLEESIQEALRWAVFEPNDPILWGKLNRVLTDFLTRVWRDGALFGDTAEKAFQVRVDEGLNPPSTRALGQLFIEIKVAAVRPAEFIVVRIGLWDGGGDVDES